jgi:hypothetical protein
MRLKIILAFISISFLTNCSLTDNESFNPAYLIIDKVDLITTISEGDNVKEIDEVFVFANGNSLGVYPLPARIPVITTGEEMTILIGGAIHPNGLASSSVEYPFFQRVEVKEDFEPGVEYPLDITFRYVTTAVFDINEGFENGNVFTKDIDNNGNTFLERSSISSTGSYSGRLSITPDYSENEVTTALNFPRSGNKGGAAFVEIDYKNDLEFVVGLTYKTSIQYVEEPLIVLKPTNSWKRVYLDITSQISNPDIEEYSIYLGYYHNGIEGVNYDAFVDNIKLVHF